MQRVFAEKVALTRTLKAVKSFSSTGQGVFRAQKPHLVKIVLRTGDLTCSQPSVSVGSTASDSTNYSLKIFRKKIVSVLNIYRLFSCP
jgi:hypothetical protein